MSSMGERLRINLSSSDSSEKGPPVPLRMWLTASLVAQQSFLYGYVFSSLNSSMVLDPGSTESECYHGTGPCPKGTIYRSMELNLLETQLATSVLILAAWIGCLIASHPSDKYGRRTTLLYNNIFFIVGGVLCAIGNKPCLFLGRVICGFGTGVEGTLVPMLLSEIAEPASRGTITIMHQILLVTAIFLVSIISYGFVMNVDYGWQYVQGGTCLPAILMLIFYKFVPESPKWLLRRGMRTEAEQNLLPLRPPGHDIAAEVNEILRELSSSSSSSSSTSSSSQQQQQQQHQQATWSDVLKSRHAVTIGCGLAFFQTMTGINSVIFYSTRIFSFAGFTDPILATCSVGIVQVIVSCYAAYIVEKKGRRILLIHGSYIMLASLIVLSSVLISSNDGSISGIIAVVSLITYVMGFSYAWGAATWPMLSEICPSHIRSKAMSIFISIAWAFNFLISQCTLSLINYLGNVEACNVNDDNCILVAQKRGVAGVYYSFAIILVLALIFLYLFVPETKGRSPEEIFPPVGASPPSGGGKKVRDAPPEDVMFGVEAVDIDMKGSQHALWTPSPEQKY